MHYQNQYYVYIITNNRNGTLYIGVTNNIQRRIYEHKYKVVEGFTKKYGVHRLVYFEIHESIESAIVREKQLKHWKRNWKIDLIEKENSMWRDLFSEW